MRPKQNVATIATAYVLFILLLARLDYITDSKHRLVTLIDNLFSCVKSI